MALWTVPTSVRRQWTILILLFSSILSSLKVASFFSPSFNRGFRPSRFHDTRNLICRQELETSSSSVGSKNAFPYEIQRFRSRAALAEHVLKEKVKDRKLLKKKLIVLQDVVQRLQRSQRNERMAWEQEIQQQTNSTAAQWRAKWQDEEQKRIEVEMSLRNLQVDLNKTRYELEAQRNNFEVSLTQLQDTYDRDRKQWQREKRLQQEQEKKVQLEIAALQKEVLDMDQSLENAQNELTKIQQGHKLRVNQLEQLLQDEQRKSKELQIQLEVAMLEQQKMKSEMEQLSSSAKESILIATSSVQAAEKREKALQDQVEKLQQQIQMMVGNQQMQTKAGATTKDAHKSNDDDAKLLELKSEVERLENQLRMERLMSATQKKIDQRQFDEALTRQRDQYELKLRWNAIQDTHQKTSLWSRMRSRFSKSIGRGQA